MISIIKKIKNKFELDEESEKSSSNNINLKDNFQRNKNEFFPEKNVKGVKQIIILKKYFLNILTIKQNALSI